MKPKLTLADYQQAAKTLNVEVAAIQAVAEVESRGSGFMADGHPVILFERHVMFRELRKKLGVERALALEVQYPDIVNQKPGGYGPESQQPTRLERASKIDRECALLSASWGKFQIMGYHWKALGYPSLQGFINAMYHSESSQLTAFVTFIKIDPLLLKALRDRDWATFARRYNGPGYAANKYDIKMANAYRGYAVAA